MSDYLNNPQKIHADIINALKAISIFIIPAAGLFLFNISIYSYKMSYYGAFHLTFIPLETSLWFDLVDNKILVMLLLSMIFFAIALIIGITYLFRHSVEKIAKQQFSWPLFLATFLLLSPFIFSLNGISLTIQITLIIVYALLIPFIFTRQFHTAMYHVQCSLQRKNTSEIKEKAVLHDVAFIILGATYLFVIFILFTLLTEFTAGKLGQYQAAEKEKIMLSGAFLVMPEHIRVSQDSIYLEGCDYKKCLGYQPINKNGQTIIQPRFFTIQEINFINPEIIER